jgi:tRNA G37 N-methylase TrmD
VFEWSKRRDRAGDESEEAFAEDTASRKVVLSTPEVLISGNHREIRLWNFRRSLELTASLRPDLFLRFAERHRSGEASARALSREEQRLLEAVSEEYGLS